MSNAQKSTATKAVEAEEKENFSFEHKGETYEFEGALNTLRKPGFLRRNRNKDQMDQMFCLLEEIAGDEALAAIDDMDEDEFEEFSDSLGEAIEAYMKAAEKARNAKKKK